VSLAASVGWEDDLQKPDEMGAVLAAPADRARKGTGADPSKTAATAPVILSLTFIRHPSVSGACNPAPIRIPALNKYG
jgi:hypothetical protein